MIWLSPASGTKECSVYFDIRDINVKFSAGRLTGVIRGLVGDGSCELWGEVFLGDAEFSQILPVWSETGAIESFSEAVDETLLLREMLTAVKDLPLMLGSREYISPYMQQNTEFLLPCSTYFLAA